MRFLCFLAALCVGPRCVAGEEQQQRMSVVQQDLSSLGYSVPSGPPEPPVQVKVRLHSHPPVIIHGLIMCCKISFNFFRVWGKGLSGVKFGACDQLAAAARQRRLGAAGLQGRV
jgi:hypothetical protein